MKIITKQPIHKATILSCYVDDDNIYTISYGNAIHITSFSQDSLRVIANQPVHINLHPISQGSVDEDCIYLPTEGPDILAIDKLYGDILSDIHCGSGIIMSDVHVDDKNIYALIGIPLSHVGKTSESQCSVVISNKQSGQQLGKTMLFAGLPNGLQVYKDQIFASSIKEIFRFNQDGELQHRSNVQFDISQIKLMWKQLFAISSYTIEIFQNNLQRVKNLFFPGSIQLVGGKDKCAIISNNTLFELNKDLVVNKIASFNWNITHADIANNYMYASDGKENLLKINMLNGTASKLSLGDRNVIKVQCIESAVLVVTKSNVFLVSI